MRTIVHVDMDAFFAAVEALDHPAYRGQPLVVGGERDSRRGVVATCSYEARRYGIHSAMPIQQAVKLCPHGIFIPPNMDRYRDVSRQLRGVFDELTPVVEPISVDEAFLDMTGCEHFYPTLAEMGTTIKQRIFSRVQLTASVGIAPNKFLAKLASDLRKPDGLVIVGPDDVDSLLADLPISRLWGVGAKTRDVLAGFGVQKIRDLRRLDQPWLTNRFGKQGRQLYLLARGMDERPVTPTQDAKSLGQETTFAEDISDLTGLRRVLADLCVAVGRRLRQGGVYARTVTLKIRYNDFTTLTRSLTLSESFQDDDTLFHTAVSLLERLAPNQPVRLVGVYTSHLQAGKQLSLFAPPRSEALSRVLDQVNTRLGKGTLRRGREGQQANGSRPAQKKASRNTTIDSSHREH